MSEYENPYAAPTTSVEPTGSLTFDDGSPEPWAVGEVISEAWGLFKQHWAPLLGTLVVGYIGLMVVQQVLALIVGGVIGSTAGANGQPNWPLMIVSMSVMVVVSMVAQAAVMPGWIRVYLMPVRGETPQFGVFFSSFSLYPKMLVSTLIVGLLSYVGLALLIVPGVILMLGTMLASFYVADGAAGVDSVKASWEATKGHKGALFVLGLALFGLNFVGALACGVGMLVTLPVSFLALAIVYTRITGRRAPRGWAAS